ncbi:LOW QUALITY PROTEIN: coiled-coil domain-containing protein 78 [Phycodurus eques]|uniref:LOW QUALITY PROTEIN: coiled-coil domain-containing protein 78 n=1 Tax=Phycodurus eques TaxID=693459 RepID=UPI002ACE9AF1|nr:LOW QUALITY PROTEIN: coiled-coil domain-containing protein 78 [Phycodurus eques]
MQPQDKSERLSIKVDHSENRVTHLPASNTDLSGRLVHSEEETLKISKELVEELLRINKMKSQFEEEKKISSIQILSQTGAITELVTERDNLLSQLQSEKSDQEYALLKKIYLALAEAHHKELGQSKELSAELLAQGRLAQPAGRAAPEGSGHLGRIFAVRWIELFKRLQRLLGNQEEMKDMLEDLKVSYEEEQRILKEKIEAMGKEQHVRNSQQKPSEQTMTCSCCRSQLKDSKRLQLQVKELHEQYRARLVCYLKDITVSSCTNTHRWMGNKLRVFVDNMLRDVRASYRAREEQLATAARVYKKGLQRTTKTHHALICAYMDQREQILAKPDKGLEPGPTETHFDLEPTEPREELDRFLQQIEEDKSKMEGQQHVARDQVAVVKTPTRSTHYDRMPKLEEILQESRSVIRKQLKEITDSLLQGSYDKEQKLITRATVAEAQVSQLQGYIDKHLDRYKQEIAHLHQLRGKKEAPGTQNNY